MTAETVINKVIDIFENNSFATLHLISFCKAFDCISFDPLLMKLQHYGVRGTNFEIIRSYLNGRKQCVKIDGKFSDFKT